MSQPRTREEAEAEITRLRLKRIEAAQDPTLAASAFRSLSNFIDAAIAEIEESMPRL